MSRPSSTRAACPAINLITSVLLLIAAFTPFSIIAGKPNKTSSPEMSDQTSIANDIVATIHTSAGDIMVRLFADTPLHTANFLKLVREGYFNGVLFHRVITDFMIQTGDPDSRNAPQGKQLGTGGPGYEIDAEINPERHFHKRGAIAAARQADSVNPERRSSGSQFYIVTGKTFTDSTLTALEQRNRQAEAKRIFDRLATENRDTIMALRRNRDQGGLQQLQEQLANRAMKLESENPAAFTPAQRQAYTTVGGTPHLDGGYSVFGEVIDGMDVVEKIERSETDRFDRPTTDVTINSITINQ